MDNELKVKVTLDNSDFKKKIQDTTNTMSKSESSLSSSLKKIGTAVAGAFAVKQIADFGVAVAKMGIEYNATLEQSTVAWTTLLGTQEQAKTMIDDIANYAARTPFSKMGVDEMAKQLHNAGFAGEDLFNQLTKFGNMGSAFGIQEDSLKEMVRQYGQVQMAGTAYTEDLNILQDRGVPIYKALAETLGVTVGEVKKFASEGKISADIYNQAIDSIASTTEGAMEAQSQTFNGMMSTLSDNLNTLAGILTKDLFNALTGALGAVLPLIEAFVQTYQQTGNIGEAFNALVPVLESMGVNVQALQEIWGIFSSVFSEIYNSMIAPIFDGFIELTMDAGEKFSEKTTTMQDIFTNLGQVFTEVYNSVILPMWEMFMDVLFTVWDFFNENIGNIINLWHTCSEAFKVAWEEVLKPVFDIVMEWVGKLWGVFNEYMPEIQRVVDEVFNAIDTFWQTALKPAFEAIGSFLQNILLPVFDTVFTYGILPIVDAVFHGIISLWDNSLKPIFQGITDFIGGVFTGDWTRAWNGVVNIFDGIMSGLGTIVKAPINAVINMVNKLIDGLNTLQVPDWVPMIGGKGVNIPRIQKLWKGSNFTLAGPTLVGEQGPELINMPRGASVLPAHKTRSVLDGASVGSREPVSRTANIIVELDGRTIARATGQELVDLIRLRTGLSL